jgi:hypothetical protein
MFVLRYADGRSAYLRVDRKVGDHGELAVMEVAKASQATGEVPAGEIVSVQKVK